jgi:hypothetical protein
VNPRQTYLGGQNPFDDGTAPKNLPGLLEQEFANLECSELVFGGRWVGGVGVEQGW